jgi:cytochrome c553
MKRIILSVMVLAFAIAVQAGDAKTGQDKDKPACCASKVKTSLQTEEGTSSTAKGCCGCCKQKSSAKQTAARQPVLMSPKAISLASK